MFVEAGFRDTAQGFQMRRMAPVSPLPRPIKGEELDEDRRRSESACGAQALAVPKQFPFSSLEIPNQKPSWQFGVGWAADLCKKRDMPLNRREERRKKGRLRVPRLVRIRPSEPHLQDFDEILPTQNAAIDSVYFVSKNQRYRPGMRLFVTHPYSEGPGSLNREYLGKVVRTDELDRGRRGIAVQLLMPIYLGGKETLR